MTRKDSIRSKDASKRWGSHEDLLNHSTQTKGNLRDLVTYQEDYIQQLEEEMGFCRNHLAETIDKVRHATLTQEKETQGKNKSIIGLILARSAKEFTGELSCEVSINSENYSVLPVQS